MKTKTNFLTLAFLTASIVTSGEILLTPQAVAAPSLSAVAGGHADAWRNSDHGSSVLTPGPGSLSIIFGAASSDAVPNGSPPPDQWQMEAITTGSGTAQYGSLALRARAEASVKPASNFFLSGAVVSLILGFTDTALVTSDTLSLGTPVTVTFVMTLEATAVHFTDEPAPAGRVGASVRLDAQVSDLNDTTKAPARGALVINSVGDHETFGTFTFDTLVGHQLAFDIQLFGGAGANIDNRDTGPPFYSEGVAEVMAEHTGEFFYQPSEDVTLLSESGHNYAVPEPGVTSLIVLGSAALLLRRSSSKRRIPRHWHRDCKWRRNQDHPKRPAVMAEPRLVRRFQPLVPCAARLWQIPNRAAP